MLFKLALLVFIGSIAIFFAQEFARFYKRIMEIKGAKLIIPMAIASWAVFHFDYWILWVLYYCKEIVHKILDAITPFIPLNLWASSVAMVLLLTVLSVLPVYLWDLYLRRKHFYPYKYPYEASTLIWVIITMLMLVLVEPNVP